MKKRLGPATTLYGTVALSFVIPRACDFFDLFVFQHTQPAAFQAPDKAVILSEALRRSIVNRGFMARSRRTPAMLVGRCFWKLSDRKLQRKIKSHNLRPKRSGGSCSSADLSWKCFLTGG